jgi:hypothetical protein
MTGPRIPTPTPEQAHEYFDSLRMDDQAYLIRAWNGGEILSGWSAMRLHSLGLIIRRDARIQLTEKGTILGYALGYLHPDGQRSDL